MAAGVHAELDAVCSGARCLQGLGHAESLAYEPWPQLDESLLREDTFTLPVQVLPAASAAAARAASGLPTCSIPEQGSPRLAAQVNGKMRGSVDVAKDIDQAGAEAAARQLGPVTRQMEGMQVVRTVWVPGKILNFIVKKPK